VLLKTNHSSSVEELGRRERRPKLVVWRMTRGVSLLLVSLGALLLGLCSGAQLRSDELALVADTACGKYPGSANADGTPQGFAWHKVLVCSTNSALMILQPPTTNTYWWVINYSLNAAISSSSSSLCYPPSTFSVQNQGACPDCSGSWVQKSLCTTGTSKTCTSTG
jgi:hypothetical protein